jgi:hypothetical protein
MILLVVSMFVVLITWIVRKGRARERPRPDLRGEPMT